MILQPPRSTRTATLFPSTTPFRSVVAFQDQAHRDARNRTLDRNTGIHHRQTAAADRRHRGRAVGHGDVGQDADGVGERSEEHTSELQSLMRISYAVFCLKKIIIVEVINTIKNYVLSVQ